MVKKFRRDRIDEVSIVYMRLVFLGFVLSLSTAGICLLLYDFLPKILASFIISISISLTLIFFYLFDRIFLFLPSYTGGIMFFLLGITLFLIFLIYDPFGDITLIAFLILTFVMTVFGIIYIYEGIRFSLEQRKKKKSKKHGKKS